MYPVYPGSGGARSTNFQNNPSPHGGTPVNQPTSMNPGLQIGSPLPLPQSGSATPPGFNNSRSQQPVRGSPTPYMNPKLSSGSSNSRDTRGSNSSSMAGESINEVDDSEVRNVRLYFHIGFIISFLAEFIWLAGRGYTID
jgi:hypothetical protein